MNLLNISGSPHVHSDESTKKIMWRVNLALVPMLLCGIAFFGLNALLISLVSVACCCLIQWLIEKFILKVPTTVCDGSAVVTGLLLAFNVPATADMIWLVAIGALVAIGIGKMTFGGLGKNPFNPALVGRVFMLISFPVQMTTWPTVGKWFPMTLDTTSGATPLGIIKEGLTHEGATVQSVIEANDLPSLTEILLGHIVIGTAFIFSGILWLCDPTQFIDPLTTILTGGIMLGACFMATDMVTSPMSKTGQLIFGFGCGLLTIIIRNWGAYPEGVSFAILLMNAVTPLINRWCTPKRFAN